jgi:hypothetical protein
MVTENYAMADFEQYGGTRGAKQTFTVGDSREFFNKIIF